jgi:enoyl-CoA hydratase
MPDLVLYDKAEGIATIALNRPEAMNAFTSAMLDELDTALRDAELDDAIHVIILKGSGPAFCVGADLSDSGSEAQERWVETEPTVYDDFVAFSDDRYRVSTWSLRKPVIAQVHGYCIGAGHDIAGQCDIIIAADTARFVHSEVRGLGVTWRHMSAYYAGPQWAKIMMFTGDPISGTEAERIGLVAKAVPEAHLEEEVRTLAARIALVPTETLALNKATINKAYELMGMREYLEFGAAMDAIAHGTNSFKSFVARIKDEGLVAALESRDGPFRRLPRPFRGSSKGSADER